MEFIHLGDPHLGYAQYGCPERCKDFARSFRQTIDYAIEGRIPLVLIPGDLFHARAIDPRTHLQAANVLRKAKEAKVTVVAIEGNHDCARYRDTHSWLTNLESLGLIRLLAVRYEGEAIRIDRHEGPRLRGAYIDTPAGIRVYGIQYLGSATAKALRDFAENLCAPHAEGVRLSVLCLHAGLEGVVPGLAGGLSPELFEPLRGKIDYIALGHVHKEYRVGGWIHNPGSIEPCSMEESRWTGGFYHVKGKGGALEVAHRSVRRRPFVSLSLAVDGLTSPQAVMDRIRAEVFAQAARLKPGDPAPVVELALRGCLGFRRGDLDLKGAEALIREHLKPVVIAGVRNDTAPMEIAALTGDGPRKTKTEIEHEVLKGIVAEDARYAPRAERLSQVLAGLKALALEKRPPEELITLLEDDEAFGPSL